MKKILIYRIGSIGDTLVALPAIWAIRNAFPEAKIVYLTNRNGEETVAERILPKELYDEIITYPKLPFGILHLGKLFTGKFDASFYLMNRNRDPFRIKRDEIFFKTLAKKVYGIEHAKKSYLPPPTKNPKLVIPEYEYLLDCIYEEKELNLPPRESIKPDLKLSESERKTAKDWIKSVSQGNKNLIGIMTSSNWKSKVWKEKNFIEVVSKLIKERDVFPIVLGGKTESEQGERLIKEWQRGANAAGKFGLRIDAAILKECKLYLGTDTGTMHIASAVGTACIALFSAIDYPNRWTPFGKGHKIIRKEVPCEGCFSRTCLQKSHECMDRITVEEVLNACLEVLDR